MTEEIKDVNAKIDEAEAAMKKYASKDTVISIGGYEFTPAKLMVAFTLVSSTLGGLYGAFEVYKDYQSMKKRIAEYVAPDLSELQAKMDIVVEKSEKSVQYTQDIKNDLKSDIRRLEAIVDSVERGAKQSQRETDSSVKDVQTELRRNSKDLDQNIKQSQRETDAAIKQLQREVDGKIQLVVELSKRPQALVINAVGKRNRGAKPFASDLYDLILQDRKNTPGSVNSIRIMSDTQLSDEGFKVYPRMLAQGHKISVYDRENPGQSFTEINFPEELEKYIKFDDTSFRRYQFVISESGAPYAETRSFFNTRRYRELAGLGLDD